MVVVSCPTGWSSYSSYCYYVSDGVAVNSSTARDVCQSMSADLVSISDNDENQFVDSISCVHLTSTVCIVALQK